MMPAAIILAGGLGTRLRSVVSDLPKCMAPVAGKPFLHYLICSLQQQGITQFIFSLGYKSESVISYVTEHFAGADNRFVVEPEPLGTGGAIRLACASAQTEDVLIVNGDTFFEVDIQAMIRQQEISNAICTLALKPMQQFDRYGVVSLGATERITAFREKKYYESGLINGGVYLLNRKKFMELTFPDKFSFEKDFLETATQSSHLQGFIQHGYFIDIGIPEDFARVQTESKTYLKQLPEIDKRWTLFLDRDGVINHEKHEDYIHHWREFSFYAGVKEAMAVFAGLFSKVIVVTNQRGVGKGVTKQEDLFEIHRNMISAVSDAGGRIDAVYFCPDINDDSPCRKPNGGMALQARQDFPVIDFAKSCMIGNTMSDMKFGHALGMKTIFLTTTRPETDLTDSRIDYVFDSLQSVAATFAKQQR